MSNKEYIAVLGLGVAGIGGYFLLRKNVNIKTTPLFMHVYVDGKEIGVAQDKGVDVHLSGQHTITFEPYTGWNTPAPQIKDFNLLNTYKLTGTYTENTSPPPPPPPSTDNLIKNADFSNALNYWATQGNAIISAIAGDVGHFLKFDLVGEGYGEVYQILDLPTPGQARLYLSSFFAGAEQAVQIDIGLLDAAGNAISGNIASLIGNLTEDINTFELAETQFFTTENTAKILITAWVRNPAGEFPIVSGIANMVLKYL